MKIEKVEIKPMPLSFEPEFHIIVEYSYRATTLLPLRFNGYLFLDRHRIAFLTEYEYKNGRSDNLYSLNSSRHFEKRDRRIFVAPISRLSLSKLEEKRNLDPKGNLTFNLHVQFVFMEPLFDGVRQKTPSNDLIVAKLNDNSLLRVITYDLDQDVTIAATDWLHDFSSKFENTKYQVFEVPLPNPADDDSDLSKFLNAAVNCLNAMEKSFSAGDWESVLKESRPVWELIRHKKEILDLLRKDELNDETIRSFDILINSHFDFASKFIHRQSRTNGLMNLNKARKEDAILIYNMAMSLVNLLTKKTNRFK